MKKFFIKYRENTKLYLKKIFLEDSMDIKPEECFKAIKEAQSKYESYREKYYSTTKWTKDSIEDKLNFLNAKINKVKNPKKFILLCDILEIKLFEVPEFVKEGNLAVVHTQTDKDGEVVVTRYYPVEIGGIRNWYEAEHKTTIGKGLKLNLEKEWLHPKQTIQPGPEEESEVEKDEKLWKKINKHFFYINDLKLLFKFEGSKKKIDYFTKNYIKNCKEIFKGNYQLRVKYKIHKNENSMKGDLDFLLGIKYIIEKLENRDEYNIINKSNLAVIKDLHKFITNDFRKKNTWKSLIKKFEEHPKNIRRNLKK